VVAQCSEGHWPENSRLGNREFAARDGDVVIAATGGVLAPTMQRRGSRAGSDRKVAGDIALRSWSSIDGVAQVVLVDGPGVTSLTPSNGAVLWKHAWAGDSIVQPAFDRRSDLLVGSGSGIADETGMLRISVLHEQDRWTVKQQWTSTGLKPYFNDFVVHDGYAFGFDGSISRASI
jgi:hypothetical protein